MYECCFNAPLQWCPMRQCNAPVYFATFTQQSVPTFIPCCRKIIFMKYPCKAAASCMPVPSFKVNWQCWMEFERVCMFLIFKHQDIEVILERVSVFDIELPSYYLMQIVSTISFSNCTALVKILHSDIFKSHRVAFWCEWLGQNWDQWMMTGWNKAIQGRLLLGWRYLLIIN